VWAGSRIAEEKDGQNNLVKRYFRQGVQVVSGDKPGLYYYTRDHLGSIRELTDATGAVRARYSYDLWGKRVKLFGDVDSDFGYAGYWELESGLKLTWYRAYSPGLGRWLSKDKIGENGGINLYSYCFNIPTNWMDSFGLICANIGQRPAIDLGPTSDPLFLGWYPNPEFIPQGFDISAWQQGYEQAYEESETNVADSLINIIEAWLSEND
jgi:RHS repeat-associated protein